MGNKANLNCFIDGLVFCSPLSVPLQPAQQPQQPQQPLRPHVREEDVTQLREMFPTLEEEVVRSVLEASNGRVDSAVTNLLQMTQWCMPITFLVQNAWDYCCVGLLDWLSYIVSLVHKCLRFWLHKFTLCQTIEAKMSERMLYRNSWL